MKQHALMAALIVWTVSGPLAALGAQSAATDVTFHDGACDASAAVPIGDKLFAVASDEDSVIRVYAAGRSGSPVRAFNFTRFLELDRKSPETDLEGATRVGDRVFWITSHARNKDGKERESRRRLFATDIRKSGETIDLVPVGRPYKELLRDLGNDPKLKRFGLAEASQKAPKESGALNIEGLCATSAGQLLIAFRNPVPQGRALLVPLLNPNEVVQGAAAEFADARLLELDGLGIREIVEWNGRYLIVAGSFDGKGRSRLYEWGGATDRPRLINLIRLPGFNAEAIVAYSNAGPERIQVLSDDSGRDIGGKPCSESPNRQFRSAWIALPPLGN